MNQDKKIDETLLRAYEGRTSAALKLYYVTHMSKPQLWYHRWYCIRKFLFENIFFHKKWIEPYYRVEFTFNGTFDSVKGKWINTAINQPDWRISLPWKKKTRGFPKKIIVKRGSDEMVYGVDLQSLILNTAEPLMFRVTKTTFHIETVNEVNKVRIYTV